MNFKCILSRYGSLRLVSCILLATYGTLSLLGHGGLHALLDDGQCCCPAMSAACSSASADQESCRNGSCDRSSQHGKHDCNACPWSHGSEATDHGTLESRSCCEGNRDHKSSAPGHVPHDSRNCRICEWHLSSQAVTCVLTEVSTATTVEFRSLIVCCHADHSSPLTTTSRGPPGC